MLLTGLLFLLQTNLMAPEVPLTDGSLAPATANNAQHTEIQGFDFLNAPNIPDATSELNLQALRLQSEVELAATLAKLNRSAAKCVSLREALEKKIGTRPGSYSVHTRWVKVYQDCVIQRRKDMATFGQVLQDRYAMIVHDGADSGATSLTTFIDGLRSRQSASAQRLDQELQIQKKFVDYYNTGTKSY